MNRILTNTFISLIFLFAASASFAEQSDADKLRAVWQDPEYQEFVQTLKPWVPPLTEEEQNISARELLARAGGQIGATIISAMPLFIQIGQSLSLPTVDWGAFLYSDEEIAEFVQNKMDNAPNGDIPARKTFFAKTTVPQLEEFIRLFGNVLIDENKLTEMSIGDFSHGLFWLGLAGSVKYVVNILYLDSSAKQEIFNWAYTSLELPEIYFPKHPDVLQKSQTGLPLLKSALQIAAPLRERLPKHYAPITNKDMTWLRSKLKTLMKPLDNTMFSKLKAGLPGHYSNSVVDEFLSTAGNEFPYLILFYIPEDYHHADFNCTSLEKMLIESKQFRNKGFSCNPRMVELMLFTALLGKAENGNKMGLEKLTYEQLYLSIFLAKHYGDLFEKLIPGFNYPEFIRHAASITVKTMELVDEYLARPENELNFLENFAKLMFMKSFRFQNQEMSQLRELVFELKLFLRE